MLIRQDLQPFLKYRATDASLNLAQDIARAMNIPFDKEAVRKQSGTLYDDMFADIVKVLGLDNEEIEFHSGIYYQTRAFALQKDRGIPLVALDMVFDHWVFSLTHLLSISAFSAPDPDEYSRITEDVSGLFKLFTNASVYEATRERSAYYLHAYSDLINLSGALARAMVVFVLCHEIAHCTLGHLKKDASIKSEMEADTQALHSFIKIMEHGAHNPQTSIHIDPKIICAPVILTMILEFYEDWASRQLTEFNFSDHHPSAQERLQIAKSILEPYYVDASKQIVKGMEMAIAEMAEFLD